MTLEKRVNEEDTGFYIPLGTELQMLVREHELEEYGIEVNDIFEVIKYLLLEEAKQGKTEYTLSKDEGNKLGIGCLFESTIIRRVVLDDMRFNKVTVYRKRNDTLGVYALEFNWED
ncbi:hypothetical protein SMUDGE_188 [Bacillus phage Smudge]|uniref:Uncharacterized protein n=1 Tax=Bacillus phage Smudge TaxID=1852566 RepID=A0A173H2U2_9CAUD|nr:hypothetical protein BI006_gp197 [Bacillus phage Nemo]AMW63713.1 hypothetical protein NEMO_197 [Bacillus phage Nemo]ANI24807.1 hypothetical protein SMUDGE_188 [Bacillus phage Smudge]AXQ67462.1 hypothetical protein OMNIODEOPRIMUS_195 [Bacillus phage OmnioDeoPrimus]